MNDPDEVLEDRIYDIKNLVKGIMFAFPNVKYVALNARITSLNANDWENEWYAVGFEEAPYMRELDGYYTWVASADVDTVGDESGVCFVHFNSDGWYYEDWKLQNSRTDFRNEDELCFYMSDGVVMQYMDKDHLLYVEEPDTNETMDSMLDKMMSNITL